ncbi:hypothetical protein [Arthrobacter bambusae]|uniref:hypothetical protein n=1 Tax=Arthrobacter bambusae TaxID=1338426 RepID=UPI0027876106|nr:hypothetical protein [Arthrobacter bambusae]MDQ0241202.1 cytochrome b [Arthrobacter bambusae]
MTLEAAVAHLAAMEAQRVRALEVVRAVAETHEQALSAYNEAGKQMQAALDAVILAGQPEGKLVKRPADLAEDLRDLDDVGGH